MKEFWTYTLMRVLLFVGVWLVVALLWSLLASGTVHGLWVTVIAFAVSGVLSWVLLGRQREAFARRVEDRASRVGRRFEEMRSREDD